MDLLKKLALEEDFGFETFNDPVLKQMLLESQESIARLFDKDYRWLVFSGPTEVGKTHLIKGIRSFVQRYNESINLKEKFNYPFYMYFTWPELIEKLMSKEITVDHLRNIGGLFIEEFLANNYSVPNAFTIIEINKAQEVLNARMGKYTVIDTNKSINEIQKIDPRIASRLLRDNAVLVDIPSGTEGFLTR